jgi:hypothetical protein
MMSSKTMTIYSYVLISAIAFTCCLISPAIATFAIAQEQQEPRDTPAGESHFRDFDMNRYAWKKRPVLLFSPTSDDKRLRQMKQQVGKLEEGIEDREIVVIELVQDGQSKAEGRVMPDEKVEHLRKQYEVEPGKFAVLLIGKDGGVKARWFEPIDLKQIFGNIDAMPMRQQEIRERANPGKNG